jgi:hypothetical protein
MYDVLPNNVLHLFMFPVLLAVVKAVSVIALYNRPEVTAVPRDLVPPHQ